MIKYYLLNKFTSYWKSFLWALIICFLLFFPGSKFPRQEIFHIPGFDKIVHFVLFLILEWLLLYDVLITKVMDKLTFIIRINLITLVFAFVTEIIQRYLIADRSGNIDDFCIDIIGLFIGVLTYDLLYRIIARLFPRNS